ncbi:L,D-transpeptidase [Rhizobiaceae sp. 2RAB30]
MSISRRSFVVGLPLILGGCATQQPLEMAPKSSADDSYYRTMYAAIDAEPFAVPAIDLKKVKPRFYRQQVSYHNDEKPGTIVVDPNERFCYLIQENGKAMRYGVGVGKIEAFNFQGEATIARKAEWPGWRPTPDMIAREPERYGPLKDGLPGGAGNPLGPRALYLYRNNQDTYYRLHGTVEPWTIGTKVSSGCIRLLNQDIMDLYSRVPVGAKAIVLPSVAASTS